MIDFVKNYCVNSENRYSSTISVREVAKKDTLREDGVNSVKVCAVLARFEVDQQKDFLCTLSQKPDLDSRTLIMFILKQIQNDINSTVRTKNKVTTRILRSKH